MNKQNSKNIELRARSKYVPSKMRVINITTGNIICTSGGNEEYQETTGTW